MRSKLFVPASRPELFTKAFASAADALSFDLEDSVAAERKPQARAALRELLRSDLIAEKQGADRSRQRARHAAFHRRYQRRRTTRPRPDQSAETRIRRRCARRRGCARTRRSGEWCHHADPAAAQHRIAESVSSRRRTRCCASARRGLATRSWRPVRAAWHRPARTGCDPAGHVHAACRGRRSGRICLRLAFANIKDEAGFRAEAQLAKSLGFLGKSCIHPSQIALANEVFRPSDDEIAHALRVVEAAREADANGIGAYVVDGKMIDPPFVERARALVRDATRLGLLDGR